MTWLLASGLVAAVAIIGGNSAAAWWFGKRALSRADALGDRKTRVAELERLIGDRDDAFDELHTKWIENKRQLAREIAARKSVEDQRDRLLKELETQGDPDAVAAGIRVDLGRLSALSEVSDVPEAAAGAGADSRDGEGAVHGGDPEADRRDGS